MNRGQLVDYILSRVGQIDSEDRSACQSFLSKRYELIWNSFLWKDSLIACDVSVDPTDDNNSEGIVLCPSMIDRVVAVRTPSNAVRIHGMEEYYAVDYDSFQKQGTAYEFALLSPIWFKWFGYVGLKIVSDNAADNGAKIKLTYRDANGIRKTVTVTLNDVNPPTFFGGLGITVSGAGTTVWNGTGTMSPDLHYHGGEDPFLFEIYNDASAWRFIGNPGAIPAYNSFGPLTGPWSVGDGAEPAPTVTPEAVTLEIESVFKPATSGTISFVPIVDPTFLTSYSLEAGDTASPKYQRIRLLGIPQQPVTLSILGKKKASLLDFDQEEPELKNIDNALIELVMGDMRDRQRQTGKAQVNWANGAQLLQELAKLETVQAANNSHFMPVQGFGDGYFTPSLGYEYGLTP